MKNEISEIKELCGDLKKQVNKNEDHSRRNNLTQARISKVTVECMYDSLHAVREQGEKVIKEDLEWEDADDESSVLIVGAHKVQMDAERDLSLSASLDRNRNTLYYRKLDR